MIEYGYQRIARRDIDDYLAYYNNERKHSAFSYLTAQQFELTIHPSN